MTRIYGFWRMWWWLSTRLVGCVLANGRDGESGGGGDGEIVLDVVRQITGVGRRKRLAGLQRQAVAVCLRVVWDAYHGG